MIFIIIIIYVITSTAVSLVRSSILSLSLIITNLENSNLIKMVVIANPTEHLLVAKILELEAGKLDLENIDLEHVDLLIEPEIIDLPVASTTKPKQPTEHFHAKFDGPAFKIVQMPCKGSGMIATRKLYPGDLILAEIPTLIIPNATFENVKKCENFLEKEINKLSSDKRQLVLGLTDCRERDLDDYYDPNPYCGMFYTNAMHFNEDAVLCPVMARANHSCIPNSEFITRADLGKRGTQHLMANYIINQGEEITINYMAMENEGSDSRETRQAYLREFYCFQCTCRACTLQFEELGQDDALRESIKELQAPGVDNLDAEELESLISRMYQINGKHSYILGLFKQLYRSAPVGSNSMAKYAVHGFTIAINLYGVGSKQAKEWKHILDFQKSINLLISLDSNLPE